MPHLEINLQKFSKNDFTKRFGVNSILTARVQQHIITKK